MEMDSRSFGGDWANDAFAALNDNALSEKWAAFADTQHRALPQSAFTIPPTLLTHGSVARYGQVTPPEELSPAEPRRSSREHSIPHEPLKNEALFPDHQIHALQSFQPQQPEDEEQTRAPKRRRTSRQPPPANQTAAPQPQQPSSDPQPPKRKRGRPKSQPQMVEAYTADGFPFQVSSARQSHLEKNRVAAHKCRQRKKEYIGGLEGRARQFTAKNKELKQNVAMLREELLELKNEVLRHAGCGFWAVDEYLTRCAGDLLGMQAPTMQQQQQQQQQAASRKQSQSHSHSHSHSQSQSQSHSPDLQQLDLNSPNMTTFNLDQMQREGSSESQASPGTTDSLDHEDYGGFDLLEDMDEDDLAQNA